MSLQGPECRLLLSVCGRLTDVAWPQQGHTCLTGLLLVTSVCLKG